MSSRIRPNHAEIKERTPHEIYIAFAEDGTCLYVGCTVDVFQRLSNHRWASAWFPFAWRYEYDAAPTRSQGLALEKQKIRELRPLFNVKHHPAPSPNPLAEISARCQPRNADREFSEAVRALVRLAS